MRCKMETTGGEKAEWRENRGRATEQGQGWEGETSRVKRSAVWADKWRTRRIGCLAGTSGGAWMGMYETRWEDRRGAISRRVKVIARSEAVGKGRTSSTRVK